MKTIIRIVILGISSCLSLTVWAKTVRYELSIENKPMNLSGKKTADFALTVNGGIPAPTLEFTEGDEAEITVLNKLPNEEVSIHWHGILLPPLEDGVAYVNTPPIFPGQSRVFRFKIRQHGTYWYHSHTMLQEQKGVFGAIVIHPKKTRVKVDHDVVVVLNDWTDENPDQVLKNLKKDGDYFLYKKNTVRSFAGAIRAGGLKTYVANQWTRMGGMDLSDVGYDAFLINGKRESQLVSAHPGEKVRLRVINASASTYFYVSLGQLPLRVISADGVDIEPVVSQEILMGMAETYDVLFTVPEHKNYELRATAQDGTGFASGWIGMGEPVRARTVPSPDLYAPMDHGGHGGHEGEHGGHGEHASHESHAAPLIGQGHGPEKQSERKASPSHPTHTPHPATKDHADHANHMSHANHSDHSNHTNHTSHANHSDHSNHTNHTSHANQANQGHHADHTNHSHHTNQGSHQMPPAPDTSPGPEKTAAAPTAIKTLTVDDLKAQNPTAYPRPPQRQDIKLTLGGDMARYVWYINGRTINQDRSIFVNEGDVIRMTLENSTMMHHPIHLHGHFFRVLNKNGEWSPLKHTVDVPPHGTRIIEVLANEPGEWMLHCHNLYHMKTGMARVLSYRGFQPSPELKSHAAHDPHMHEHTYFAGSLDAFTNLGEFKMRASRTWQAIEARVETKREGADWENEADVFYRHYLSPFSSVILGGSHFHDETRGLLGFSEMLPLLIESTWSIDSRGKGRLDLGKRLQWTSTVFSDLEVRLRDGFKPDWTASLAYAQSWGWSAGLKFTDGHIGVGMQKRF